MSEHLATPKKNTSLESLRRIIGSLNQDYSLNLQVPDPRLSPSRRKDRYQTEEQVRAATIYDRAQHLFFKRPKDLQTCIGRFRIEADKLSKGWVSKPNADPDTIPRSVVPLGVHSLEERAALQKLFMQLLQDVGTRSWTKRRSDDFTSSCAKRSRLNESNDHVRDIDDLPVQSRLLTHQSPATHAIELTESRSFSTTTSANSSKLSLAPSSVFSPPNSQSTVATNHSQRTLESIPIGTQEYLALDESFTAYGDPADDNLSHQPNAPGGPHHYGSIKESSSAPAVDEITTPCLVNGQHTEQETLSDRLKNIWPKFPIPGLNHAPLIILWELNRFALHCDVNLDLVKLQYQQNDSWHNQTKFRGLVLSDPEFVGKGLPPSCDNQAWEAGLGSFHIREKAVTLCAELSFRPEEKGPLFSLKLQPPKFELGHRLSRRFGADRFMEVIIASPNCQDVPPIVGREMYGVEKIIRWLTGNELPHYFLGRTWTPFFTRDFQKSVKDSDDPQKTRHIMLQRIHFFASDGNGFTPQEALGSIPKPEEALRPFSRKKMSTRDLLVWALDINVNADQPIPKLFSRIKLSLSRTWPTVTLEKGQIRHHDADLGKGKPMNDGIGRLSYSLARKITACLNLDRVPTCFQGRLGSAKGIWIIDVESYDLDETDWIETYPSQRKWKCAYDDVHHRTLEIRSWPKELKKASLNQQFIPILEAQAKDQQEMRRCIADHLVNSLREGLCAQTVAMESSMDCRLWMQQAGFISNERQSRGFVPFLGGLPREDEEAIAFLLDSGFEIDKVQILKDMFWKIRVKQAETLKTKMNVEIPRSVNAYMVIDFTGTLEENEVQLAFSTEFLAEGHSETLLDGVDVLVARSPAHFVSDIQKVRAVFKPNLRHLKNVIVFSSKGTRPLADKLSGGDYDGDQAWVCWDPKLVNNFTNADVPSTPDLKSLGYIRSFNQSFEEVLKDSSIKDAYAEFIYKAMSFSMQPPMLGICTAYKERFCYDVNDVKHENAVILSTLAGLLVDQSKQGTMFNQEDFDRLRSDFKMDRRLKAPEYKNEKSRDFQTRSPGKVHILDHLKFEIATMTIQETLADFWNSISLPTVQMWDADLAALFNDYDRQRSSSRTIEKLMAQLRIAVEDIGGIWTKKMAKNTKDDSDYGSKVREIHDKWLQISPPKELLGSKAVSMLLDSWNGDPGLSKWSLLKASTFFKYCHRKSYKAVWTIAGRQLAHMKAIASGRTGNSAITITGEMWNVLRPNAKLIKSFAMRRKAEVDENESVLAIEEVTEFDDDGTQIDDA